ncbi:MAG TPA: hypothetical protein GX708_20990 [Gallicola sp.]|jgi:hypothetical protein|nr:hypothetical protein [Gallicola sp.]
MYRKIVLLISLFLLCSFFIANCDGNKKKHSIEKVVQSDKINIGSTMIRNDSLNIQLILSSNKLNRGGKSIDYLIINNSDYQISMDDSYTLRYFEFGTWGKINPVKNTIWYDIETILNPTDSTFFTIFLDFFDFDFPSGKYLIEKKVNIINDKYKIDNNQSVRFIGQQVLIDEFVID